MSLIVKPMHRMLLTIVLAVCVAGCSPVSTTGPSTTLPTATPTLASARPTLTPTAAPTATPTSPTAEVVIKTLLVAEQAGDLEQVMRFYDVNASHILLEATTSKRSANFTTYYNSPDQLRAYFAALLQDHLTVEVLDVLVSTNVPPTFSAGLGGKAEQVTVRSRQSLDSQRQAGFQFAQVLDNYLVVAGKIISQSTIIAHAVPATATPLAPNAFPTGVYAATRNAPPPNVAFGHGFLVFAEQNRFYLISANNGILDNGPYQTSGNQLLLTSNDPDCQKAGRSPDFTYQWALEGQLLNLTTVVDRCGSGHALIFVSGPWTRRW
ncbi:MAG: hypothetical protein HY259_04730 [Chloroflexi bacterium]|nr:hypothetical protein [Chloroflexota bacterium]MBI3732748.1 hypothetical protein [Chloroflexota bacterium]